MADSVQVTKTTETVRATGVVHTPEPQKQNPDGEARLYSNILAIAGSVIPIVIVLWGLFHIASLSQPWLSSLFRTPSTIQVTAPAQVRSGDTFTVSWKYSAPEKGTYAFLYQCKETLRLDTPVGNGSMTSIPCGAAYTVGTTNAALSLAPKLSGTATTSVALTVIFMPSATTSKQVQGSANVMITPSATPAPVIAPVVPEVIERPETPARPASPADLFVQIISVSVDASGTGVATFDISNIGGSVSGTYYFSSNLPTQSGYAYTSPAQNPLAPGDHVLNTLRFTQATGGEFSVAVGASDANQSNNYASQSVSMPYYPNQYQYQTYQQPYQYPYTY